MKLSTIITLLLFSLNLNAAELDKDYLVKPYTLRTDKGEVLLKFHLKESKNLKIFYQDPYSSTDKGDDDFREYPSDNVVSVNLGNQGCGEKIRYRIVSKEFPEKPVKRFIPSYPCLNSFLEEDVVFGFLTDTQMDVMNRLKKISTMISAKEENYSFILNSGDVIQKGGSLRDWYKFFNSGNAFLKKTPLIAAVGNHAYYTAEEGPEVPELFQKFLRWDDANDFGGLSVDLHKFQLIVYNSNTHKLSPDAVKRQYEWLEAELLKAHNDLRPVIFSAHYPPFSSSGFHQSDKAQELRDRVVPLLEKYKVKLALMGHTHIYERSFKNGVHYVIGGPAGGMYPWFARYINPHSVFTKQKVSTFSRIKVGHGRIAITTWDEDGRIIDELSISL